MKEGTKRIKNLLGSAMRYDLPAIFCAASVIKKIIILTILFNIFIFIVSFRENEKELENSELDIENIENLTH